MAEDKPVQPQQPVAETEQPQAQAPEPASKEETPSPSPEAQPQAEGEAPKPQPPSRVRRFFRRVLRWLAFIALLFLAGFLTAVAMLVQPQSQRLAEQQAEMRALQATQQALEDDLNQKQARIRELEDRIQDLEAQLQQAQKELQQAEAALAAQQRDVNWLQSVRYGYRALLALENEDVTQARIYLKTAATYLSKVQENAPEEAQTALQDLQERVQDLLPQLAADQTTRQNLIRWLESLESLEALLQAAP